MLINIFLSLLIPSFLPFFYNQDFNRNSPLLLQSLVALGLQPANRPGRPKSGRFEKRVPCFEREQKRVVEHQFFAPVGQRKTADRQRVAHLLVQLLHEAFGDEFAARRNVCRENIMCTLVATVCYSNSYQFPHSYSAVYSSSPQKYAQNCKTGPAGPARCRGRQLATIFPPASSPICHFCHRPLGQNRSTTSRVPSSHHLLPFRQSASASLDRRRR